MIIEHVKENTQWTQYMHMVGRALAYSAKPEDSIANVMRALWDDRGMLLRIVDDDRTMGVCVLEKCQHEGERSINVWALAGTNMDMFIDDLMAYIDDLALDQEVANITMSGRLGWERVLNKQGFEPHTIMMHKRVVA